MKGVVKIKSTKDLFYKYVIDVINEDRDYKGIIKTDDVIVYFTYINEIDDFFVSMEDDSEVIVPEVGFMKKTIIQAFKSNELIMFTNLDDVRSRLMEVRVEKFLNKYLCNKK